MEENIGKLEFEEVNLESNMLDEAKSSEIATTVITPKRKRRVETAIELEAEKEPVAEIEPIDEIESAIEIELVAENEVAAEIESVIEKELVAENEVAVEILLATEQEIVQEIEPIGEIEPALEIESIVEIESDVEIQEIVQIKSETISEIEPKIENEEISTQSSDLLKENLESLEIELIEHKSDFSNHSKKELLDILESSLESIKKETATNNDFKKADLQLKEIKAIFDVIKIEEKKAALEKYIAENESEDGFEYKEEAEIVQFDTLYKKIKEAKFHHFNDQEKNKEKNFTVKTELLNQLRNLADSEDGNISTIKANIVSLKKLQQEWKDAGNISTPHNNTLWQTYHALVDRFYSNRGIYFELLELDRKKNLNLKVELCTKVENIAQKVQEEEISSKDLQEASHLYEEFKHIGPASKDANELLWQRFKAALDVIYDKRRGQLEALKGTFEENLIAKQKVLESLALFTSFTSESINEWMEQTKAIDILQKQWDAIKGPLPKDKTREISKNFWNGVKQFYKNKGDFFRALEAKRDENLKLKQSLCEQVETFLASEEDSAEITKAVIKLQEDWRKIGHVPDKFRNKIYDRFKAACDAYFNKKRLKSNESDKVFIENLAKKVALCERIERESNNSDIANLSEIKKEWSSIGFVPKAEMVAIQKRYITAINTYVGALGKLSDKEKEKLSLQTEIEILKQNDKVSIKDLGRKEGDIRSKIQTLENDLSTLKNNLEFFARSKNADKLKADFEQKIKKGEEDLAHMKHQLKVVRQAAE